MITITAKGVCESFMNKKLSRRDFIKLMGIGTVGAVVALFTPSIFKDYPDSEPKSSNSPTSDFLHFDAAPFGLNVGVSHPLEAMEPFNFLFTSQIWGGPKENERNRWEIWKRNKDKFAKKLTRLVQKLPLALDIEGRDPDIGFKNSAWYVDIRRDDTTREIVDEYVQHRLEISDWVRAHYDGPVSHYSTWPLSANSVAVQKIRDNKPQYKKHYTRLEEANELLNPLRDDQDFYTPYGYYDPGIVKEEYDYSEIDHSVEHFKTYADIVRSTGKPVYPVVSPQYQRTKTEWFRKFIPSEKIEEIIPRWENESGIPGVVWWVGASWKDSSDTSQWKPWHEMIKRHKSGLLL